MFFRAKPPGKPGANNKVVRRKKLNSEKVISPRRPSLNYSGVRKQELLQRGGPKD